MSIPDWFAQISVMNLLLIDHSILVQKELSDKMCVDIHVDEENLFLCLTGLKKAVYTGIFHFDVMDYSKIYYGLKTPEFLEEHGYTGDYFAVFNDGTKRLIVLFSPTKKAVCSTREMAEHILWHVQEYYEQHIFRGNTDFANVLAFVPVQGGLKGVHKAFEKANHLYDLSFFHMSPCVFTDSWLLENMRELSYHNLMEQLHMAEVALIDGNGARAREVLRDLFLDKLKNSYSLSLCMDALSFLKNVTEQLTTVYKVELTEDIGQLFDVNHYFTIEACFRAIDGVLTPLCQRVRSCGAYSKTVMLAAYYIYHHHKNTELSLPDIAEYVGTNPSYLSSVFKAQMGVSIRQFITQQRLQTACTLLRETKQKTAEISAASGFLDVKYFGQVFRSHLGMGPQEYRDQNLLSRLHNNQ